MRRFQKIALFLLLCFINLNAPPSLYAEVVERSSKRPLKSHETLVALSGNNPGDTLVVNGDFETGDFGGWTVGSGDGLSVPGARYASVVSDAVFKGRYSARLGRWDTPYPGEYAPELEPWGYDWMYQNIELPRGKEVKLSFYYNVLTYDTQVWDWFDMFVRDPNTGAIIEEVVAREGKPGYDYGTFWTSGWRKVEFDLTPHQGRVVQLWFGTWQDQWGDQSGTLIDEVKVEVGKPTGLIPTIYLPGFTDLPPIPTVPLILITPYGTTEMEVPVLGGIVTTPSTSTPDYLYDNVAQETCGVGDSVNYFNGANLYQNEDFSYYSKGLPVGIRRVYTTLNARNGPFGYGWTHNYNLKLEEKPDGSVALIDEAGMRYTYTKRGDGTYQPPDGIHTTLTKLSTHYFVLQSIKNVKWNFSPEGSLLSLQDASGNKIDLKYNADGYLSKIVDASGRATVISYNLDAKIEAITDPAGRRTTYLYDRNDNLLTKTDAEGNTMSYAYDGEHHLTGITDAKGSRWSFTYQDGAVVSRTDPKGSVTTYDYSFGAGETVKRDPAGASTSFTFDRGQGLITKRDALGGVTRYNWESDRWIVTDANGNARTFTFSNGKVTSLIDALGNTTSYDYDQRGDLVRMVDPLGRTTTIAYNQEHHPVKFLDSLRNATTLTYL